MKGLQNGTAVCRDRLLPRVDLRNPVPVSVHAAAIAARFAGSARCGLVTHVLFERNEFSEQLQIEEACLVAPRGTGIGFDELLDRYDQPNLEELFFYLVEQAGARKDSLEHQINLDSRIQ